MQYARRFARSMSVFQSVRWCHSRSKPLSGSDMPPVQCRLMLTIKPDARPLSLDDYWHRTP